MDSLLRRYYVPRIVLRQIRLSDTKTIDEVIDGQQRINTLQDFFAGKFALPKSLVDLSPDLAGKKYPELDVDIRQYVDQLELQADRILNIENKDDSAQQRVATEIFWRLQQGESLNSMEIAHARLSSKARNFLVKYSDNITFDHQGYIPLDTNANKHNFFKIISRENQRMQHLALLARMLVIEKSENYPDLKDKAIQELVDDSVVDDGIGNETYENEPHAIRVLKNLDVFYSLFENDPMIRNGEQVKELNREYLIISWYVLISYLVKYYVINDDTKTVIRSFFDDFYARWSTDAANDVDIVRFRENRQQDSASLKERDIILRHNFFQFISDQNFEVIALDKQRAFNEAQRIEIYRRDKGICQACVAAGKSEKEATVSWSQYQADHILPWIKGGQTDIENAQVLCSYHNQSKGAS